MPTGRAGSTLPARPPLPGTVGAAEAFGKGEGGGAQWGPWSPRAGASAPGALSLRVRPEKAVALGRRLSARDQN